MEERRHRAVPVRDGYEIHRGDRKLAAVGFRLARDEASLARLLAALDRIHARAAETSAQGGPIARLALRRDTDETGRRTWAVREERDYLLDYVDTYRSLLDLAPPRRAMELLRAVRAVVAAGEGAGIREDGPMNVVRFAR